MTEQLARLKTALTCAVALLVQLALVPLAWAQGSGRLVLPRLDGRIRLDGLSDEPAWQAVQPWLPTQYEPDNGAPPTERTEFLVAYDDDYLYFALRGYASPHPDAAPHRHPDGSGQVHLHVPLVIL